MKNRTKPLLKQLPIIMVLMAIIPASEALTVIYDSGNTQPMSRYLPQRFEQGHTKKPRQSVFIKKAKNIGLCAAHHNTFTIARRGNGQPKSITLFTAATFFGGFRCAL